VRALLYRAGAGDPKGPLSIYDLYGAENPWNVWLLAHAAVLLRLTPRELWTGPDVGEMTRGEQDELRRLGKVGL
jgi:hypothetical protein